MPHRFDKQPEGGRHRQRAQERHLQRQPQALPEAEVVVGIVQHDRAADRQIPLQQMSRGQDQRHQRKREGERPLNPGRRKQQSHRCNRHRPAENDQAVQPAFGQRPRRERGAGDVHGRHSPVVGHQEVAGILPGDVD
jgi:hypothetical protein